MEEVHVGSGVNYSRLFICAVLGGTSELDKWEWFRLFYAPMIHIGQAIEEELRRQGRSVTWFAARLYCDRTNVYKIFRKRSIDTETLYRISMILGHDFFRDYTADIAACPRRQDDV